MAITVDEQKDGREKEDGKQSRIRRKYWIKGTADDSEAKSSLRSYTPTTLDGLDRESTRVSAHSVDVSRPDISVWNGTVSWSDSGSGDESETTGRSGSIDFSASTTGGSRHISHSKQTVSSYASTSASQTTPPDWNNAIGVKENDGSLDVEGVDVLDVAFSPTETHYKTVNSYFWNTYLSILEDQTATVNNSTFRGRAAGEVLFRGVSNLSLVSGGDGVEITYEFAVKTNITDASIGDISGIDKRGHDYLWLFYETKKDASGNKIKFPAYAYVEQVYSYTDFSNLSI